MWGIEPVEMQYLPKNVIYFLFYSMLGYVCEVVYCSIPAKRLVNRGFLHGPYLPIYGFGALSMILLLSPYKESPCRVFLSGMVLTGILEYLTGFLLEKLFHAKLWDYSSYRFNINGRVCLLNSTMFGILGVVVMYAVHPWISRIVTYIPDNLLFPVSSAILVVLAADTTASAFHMSAFQERLGRIKALRGMLEERLEKLEDLGPAVRGQLEAELERLKEQLRSKSKRILDAFPGFKSKEYESQLAQVRKGLTDWRAEQKNKRRDARKKNDRGKH